MIKDTGFSPLESTTRQEYQDQPPSFAEATSGTSGAYTIRNGANLPRTAAPAASEWPQLLAPVDQSAIFDLEGSPPDFSAWAAEFHTTSSGRIYSHDAHLNEDGEALCRFILSHLDTPKFRVRFKGTHTEERLGHHHNSSHHRHHHRLHRNHSAGTDPVTSHSHSGSQTTTITDFDFFIDLSDIVASCPPDIYTYGDDVPAYRGKMVKEVSESTPEPPVQIASHSRDSIWHRLRAKLIGKSAQRVKLDGLDEETGLLSSSCDIEAQSSMVMPRRTSSPSSVQGSTSIHTSAPRTLTSPPLNSVSPIASTEAKSWRRATRAEKRRVSNFRTECEQVGLPPWTSMEYIGMAEWQRASFRQTQLQGIPAGTVLASTKSVRAWADEYCASEKIMKEFKFRKVVYGWDFAALRTALENLILTNAHYGGKLTIEFESECDEISIRPSTAFSRALSNPWILVLLWLTLIYPFIWLFRRYHKCGGGRWEVCGAAYTMKRYVPCEGATPGSLYGLMVGGKKEGEWLRAWEGSVINAVMTRTVSERPLVKRGMATTNLDGYHVGF